MKPPLPPFTLETAIQKVRMAEDGWNSRDPDRVALAYTLDSQWRNRASFPKGASEIIAFLTAKWARELDYRLIKEIWAFTDNRIAVRFAYEWHDAAGQWFRSYGNENWEFDTQGLMQKRFASINDLADFRKRSKVPLAARTPSGRPPRPQRSWALNINNIEGRKAPPWDTSLQRLAFTPEVKAAQEQHGSRRAYARMEAGEDHHDVLGPSEAGFIAARDSFYMATVSETGWPYIQHRGGPVGFVRVLDDKTIGFADFRGNRQYVSVGNLQTEDRVSLFLMDYPNRARLKILGRARIVDANDKETLQRLSMPEYEAQVERGILISIEAFDWNCPQHITPRFTLAEIEEGTAPLRQRIAELEEALQLKAQDAH